MEVLSRDPKKVLSSLIYVLNLCYKNLKVDENNENFQKIRKDLELMHTRMVHYLAVRGNFHVIFKAFQEKFSKKYFFSKTWTLMGHFGKFHVKLISVYWKKNHPKNLYIESFSLSNPCELFLRHNHKRRLQIKSYRSDTAIIVFLKPQR